MQKDQEDPREYVRMLAALAGLPMTVQGIAAVALDMPLLHGGCEALADVDYGDIEPSVAFAAPRGAADDRR